jgi:hypothetical protein
MTDRFRLVAWIVQWVAALGVFWLLGLRTIFFGLCLCFLMSLGCWRLWRRLRK